MWAAGVHSAAHGKTKSHNLEFVWVSSAGEQTLPAAEERSQISRVPWLSGTNSPPSVMRGFISCSVASKYCSLCGFSCFIGYSRSLSLITDQSLFYHDRDTQAHVKGLSFRNRRLFCLSHLQLLVKTSSGLKTGDASLWSAGCQFKPRDWQDNVSRKKWKAALPLP